MRWFLQLKKNGAWRETKELAEKKKASTFVKKKLQHLNVKYTLAYPVTLRFMWKGKNRSNSRGPVYHCSRTTAHPGGDCDCVAIRKNPGRQQQPRNRYDFIWKLELESPISQAEIRNVISLTENGKSPGYEGYPVKYSKEYCRYYSPNLWKGFSRRLLSKKMSHKFSEA